MKSAQHWINKLKLTPHPEGGYFRENYRSDDIVNHEHLPERFSGHRNISTSIYFLLEGNQFSILHRIKSDEIWHFYEGCGLLIYSIDENGKLTENKLGLDSEKGEIPQLVIKAGDWFGAKLSKPDSYCLAGCTVSPGFDFNDFEMGDKKVLFELFPEHRSLIEELT